MAEMRAGVWLSLFVIYFMLFIIIVNGATKLSIETGEYNQTITGTNLASQISAENICTLPRFFIGGDGSIEKYSIWNDDSLNCQYSKGVVSEYECNKLNGCNWTIIDLSVWAKFWGYDNETYLCEGYIDANGYGLAVDVNATHTNYIKTGDTLLWGFASVYSDAPCYDNAVIFNRTLCNLFSCSWVSYDFSDTIKATSLISTFSEIFGWRHTFGFSNPTIALLLNLFLVILPQLGIILAGYFLIR